MVSEANVNRPNGNQSRSKRIPVVDDEPIVMMMVEMGLERFPNCKILTASTGREALQKVNGQSLDLLITDYCMPDMDGLTLAAQLKQRYPGLPVIMVTAHANNDDLQQQTSTLAIQAILDKPLDMPHLEQLVSKYLAIRAS